MDFETIAFVASEQDAAKEAEKRLVARYDSVHPDEADIVIALGGDGFMLQTLHRYMERRIPIYGMNRGSVGFLMNLYRENDLIDRLRKSQAIDLYPLHMRAIDVAGAEHEALAINEVSLLRQSRLTAKIRIEIDGIVRMEEMVGDGILVSTPAGSTAYNNAVYGPIVPLGTDLLVLTPISAFRPRRWHGALLPYTATVTFEILDPRARSVSAVADFTEVRDVVRIEVREDRTVGPTLLFDPEHNLEERIVKEQFVV